MIDSEKSFAVDSCVRRIWDPQTPKKKLNKTKEYLKISWTTQKPLRALMHWMKKSKPCFQSPHADFCSLTSSKKNPRSQGSCGAWPRSRRRNLHLDLSHTPPNTWVIATAPWLRQRKKTLTFHFQDKYETDPELLGGKFGYSERKSEHQGLNKKKKKRFFLEIPPWEKHERGWNTYREYTRHNGGISIPFFNPAIHWTPYKGNSRGPLFVQWAILKWQR